MVPSYYPKPPQIRVRDDDADHDDDELTPRDRNPIKQVPNIAFSAF